MSRKSGVLQFRPIAGVLHPRWEVSFSLRNLAEPNEATQDTRCFSEQSYQNINSEPCYSEPLISAGVLKGKCSVKDVMKRNDVRAWPLGRGNKSIWTPIAGRWAVLCAPSRLRKWIHPNPPLPTATGEPKPPVPPPTLQREGLGNKKGPKIKGKETAANLKESRAIANPVGKRSSGAPWAGITLGPPWVVWR